MNAINEWQYLQPEQLRLIIDGGYGGPGLGGGSIRPGSSDIFEKFDQAVKRDGPAEALQFLKNFIENDEGFEIESRIEIESIHCRALDWLVSLCLRCLDDAGKSQSIAILKNVVTATLDKGWNEERQHALAGLAILAGSAGLATDALSFLLDLTNREDLSKRLRQEVLLALAKARVPQAIEPLARSVIESGELAIVQAMQEFPNISWTEKSKTFIELVKKSSLNSSEVKADAVVKALMPSVREEDDPIRRLAKVGEVFIEASRKQDERVAGVFAMLLKESVGGDQILAGHRIKAYQEDHQVPQDELKTLCETLGGSSALRLIDLQKDLEINFHIPIQQLNEDTRSSWGKAIKSAQIGLLMRLSMSGTVFVVGIILLLSSSWQMVKGDGTNHVNLNTLIPFCSGLGTMLLIIYTGPLKEIRQAVTDLAIANAAFIAYVHRVLETSHTFTFYYLKQQISFDDLLKSSQIIDQAMDNTIDALNKRAMDSSEGTIIKALKMIFNRRGTKSAMQSSNVTNK